MPNWKSYESSVRLLSAILAAHPELRLNYGETAKCFGGDCTPSALENRFRRIKTDAKCIKDALSKGIDPITLAIEGGRVEKEVAKYYGDCTASSLDHRFRPLKKEAQRMRESMSGTIADKYGEDATAKAVSTRFERMKKEPSWLTDGSLGSTTPSKSKSSGVKKAKNGSASTGDQGNSDDEELTTTPIKKTPKKVPINRTQGGRVAKRTPHKASQASPIYLEFDEEEDIILKTEANGGDDEYENGMEVDDNDRDGPFYDADEA